MVMKWTLIGPTADYSFQLLQSYIMLLQQLVTYACCFLLIIFFISIFLNTLSIKNRFFSSLFSCIKFLNMFTISFIFLCVFIKFNLYIWNFKAYSQLLADKQFLEICLQQLPYTPTVNFNGSLLSDIVILLAFSSGMVCLYLLGEKNLSKYLSNLGFFCFFFVSIILMVYTMNLLIMFISFEFLFLPTLYFVYSHGYVQKVDKTLKILLYWTLCGAFLVLTSLAYLFFKYKTLNFYYLHHIQFSGWEKIMLFITIFLGFGVKVPVTPFHYWLTKIHVEAPAGFSIFLSGFLVKAAIYCFYSFNLILNDFLITVIILVVAFLGILEASVKMWTQTDFKKLIAYATIQEMNLILFLLICTQNLLDYGLLLFILIHGWLSTLMFFIVDIIQKKTQTRNITLLTGLGVAFPSIRWFIWLIILLFSGFPLTIKFVIEWQIFGTIFIQSPSLEVFVFLVIAFFGVIGFAKQMLIIMYGIPRKDLTVNTTISKRDKHLFYIIIILLIYLNGLNFFLA